MRFCSGIRKGTARDADNMLVIVTGSERSAAPLGGGGAEDTLVRVRTVEGCSLQRF